jgi:hypothetical protein
VQSLGPTCGFCLCATQGYSGSKRSSRPWIFKFAVGWASPADFSSFAFLLFRGVGVSFHSPKGSDSNTHNYRTQATKFSHTVATGRVDAQLSMRSACSASETVETRVVQYRKHIFSSGYIATSQQCLRMSGQCAQCNLSNPHFLFICLLSGCISMLRYISM